MAEVEGFDAMVCSAVDQVLEDVLGLTVTDSLYMHLREDFGLSRDQVPYRLDTFFSALDKVFGVQSSLTISKLVARSLSQRLRMRLENDSTFELPAYVDEQAVLPKVNQLFS